MATWEEIRDEIAGMLADGKPLEDVIAKLEKQKNEMAKANLIAVMDEMKKPKPMTEEEYLKSCTTEQLADVLADVSLWIHPFMKQKNRFELLKKQFYVWLKQPHTPKE